MHVWEQNQELVNNFSIREKWKRQELIQVGYEGLSKVQSFFGLVFFVYRMHLSPAAQEAKMTDKSEEAY